MNIEVCDIFQCFDKINKSMVKHSHGCKRTNFCYLYAT
jgi:hypothetical protein